MDVCKKNKASKVVYWSSNQGHKNNYQIQLGNLLKCLLTNWNNAVRRLKCENAFNDLSQHKIILVNPWRSNRSLGSPGGEGRSQGCQGTR